MVGTTENVLGEEGKKSEMAKKDMMKVDKMRTMKYSAETKAVLRRRRNLFSNEGIE
jgi:hypothetical protein